MSNLKQATCRAAECGASLGQVGQAKVEQRALLAGRLAHGRREARGFAPGIADFRFEMRDSRIVEQSAQPDDGGLGARAQVGGELDFSPPLAGGVLDGPARDRDAEHLLETQSLGANLDVVVFPRPSFAQLELDRAQGGEAARLDN